MIGIGNGAVPGGELDESGLSVGIFSPSGRLSGEEKELAAVLSVSLSVLEKFVPKIWSGPSSVSWTGKGGGTFGFGGIFT